MELRNWNRNRFYEPQWILIHAVKKFIDKNAPEEAWEIAKQFETSNYRGYIIGKTYLDRQVRISSAEEFELLKPLHMATNWEYKKGMFGFYLKDSKPFEYPFQYTGQRFFFPVPDELLIK